MLWPALPGVAETRPNYPRDVFRRYTAHDVAMQRGFQVSHASLTGRDALEPEYADQQLYFRLIVNRDYTSRVQELTEVARHDTRMTSHPAYRLLQILTRTKGRATL
jgi:hypothetical protein